MIFIGKYFWQVATVPKNCSEYKEEKFQQIAVSFRIRIMYNPLE